MLSLNLYYVLQRFFFFSKFILIKSSLFWQKHTSSVVFFVVASSTHLSVAKNDNSFITSQPLTKLLTLRQKMIISNNNQKR